MNGPNSTERESSHEFQSGHESSAGPESSLVARILHIGMAQAAQLGVRASLFLAFGLALDPATYGAVAILFAMGNIAGFLTDMGAGTVMLRQGASNLSASLPAVGGMLLIRIGIGIPILGLYLIVAKVVLHEQYDPYLASAFGVYCIVYEVVQTAFAFLRGIRRTAFEGVGVVTLHSAEMLAIATWYWFSARSLLPLMLVLGGMRAIFVVLVVTVLLVRFHSGLDVGLGWQFLRRNADTFRIVGFYGILQLISSQLDVFVLRAFLGPEEVGRYWACHRLLQVLLMPAFVLVRAVLPRLAAATTTAQRRSAYQDMHVIGLTWAGFVLAVGWLESEFLVNTLLGAEFRDVGNLFIWVALAVTLTYVPPYGLGLTVDPKPSGSVRATLGAAMFAVPANLVLIPKFGTFGAAWAMIAWGIVLKLLFIREFRERQLSWFPGWAGVATIVALGAAVLVPATFGAGPIASICTLAGVAALVIGRVIQSDRRRAEDGN